MARRRKTPRRQALVNWTKVQYTLSLVLALLCASCAPHHQAQHIPFDPAGVSDTRDPYEQQYLVYSGAQQDWPTRPGSLGKVVDGVPIYYGYPAQPYVVLGVIQAHELNEQRLAQSAHAHQAAAIIIADSRDTRTGTSVEHGIEWNGAHWRAPSQDTFREETKNTTVAVLIRLSTATNLQHQPYKPAQPIAP